MNYRCFKCKRYTRDILTYKGKELLCEDCFEKAVTEDLTLMEDRANEETSAK